MASGDSAIEIIELTQSPDHTVAEVIEEPEPLEEDVFLPTTPVSKFSKISAQAHSTPRPIGSLTDSDAHLRMGFSPNYTTNGASDPQQPRDGRPPSGNAEPKPCDHLISAGRKQFFFCLALFAMAVLVGFLAGYFVREKVYEREAVLESGNGMSPSELKELQHQQAVANVSAERIANYTNIFSQHQCAIGIPCSQSMSTVVAQQLRDMGFTNVDVSSYNVLTSHPDMSRMSTLQTVNPDGVVLHLEVLYGEDGDGGGEDGDGGSKGKDGENVRRRRRRVAGSGDEMGSTSGQSTVMYMPFSGSGQAQGELVYVHYASEGDFLTLSQSNIDVTGKVAIARQGTMMVTDQVRNVEEQGMVGLILYTDPADMDVIMTMGTERLVGMTGMMGDALTLGCPAMDGINRMSVSKAGLPSIPVQPVSADLATSLLGNLTGRTAPSDWQGGLATMYNMGRRNTRKPTWTVQLDVSNTQKQQAVHDVIATITGTRMPDEYIILGGHFSSMMATMAGMTSGHGSMSMVMEMATVMSQMMTDGWQPQRSVVLGLWGGTEYGHAGSMEWVEEHRSVLNERAVSYIDLDTMMEDGGMVIAQTSPLLMSMMMEAATMLDLADVIQPGMLSGVGDHVAFSHMLGIPSASLRATLSMQEGSVTGSPTPSMSVTRLATQMVLILADSDMIPFEASAMGEMLVGYVGSLDSKMGDMLTLSNMTLNNLKMAVSDFMDVAMGMQSLMGDHSMMESSITMTMVNHRLMYMERSFVGMDPSGSMTHVLYGMTEMETFPLVAEFAPTDMNNETMVTMMEKVSVIQCSIQSATVSLKMDFS